MTGLATRVAWTAYAAAQVPRHRRAQFASPAARERAQGRRVRAAVAHAYAHVPYYRRLLDRTGVRPRDIRTAADLARLPVVERAELQHDHEAFISRARPREEYVQLATDGTSGQSVVVYHDPLAIMLGVAHTERREALLFRLTGRRLRMRRTAITDEGSTLVRTTSAFRSRSLVPSGLRYTDSVLSMRDPVAVNAQRVSELRPDVLRAYGSYAEALFLHVHRTGMAFHAPKVVLYGADSVSEPVRRLMRAEYGVVPISGYGAGEAHHIGFECEHGTGLHLNDDLYPVRIVDAAGDEVPDGEPGDVVVTNLVNRATVLLNYRLGDRARMLPGPCPCGRTTPRLSLPEGRVDDWVQGPDGEPVHAQQIRGLVLPDDQWVLAFQIEQRGPRAFGVSIVLRPGSDGAAVSERIRDRFERRFGEGTTTQVTVVDELARTPGGKVRVVTSRLVPAPSPAAP